MKTTILHNKVLAVLVIACMFMALWQPVSLAYDPAVYGAVNSEVHTENAIDSGTPLTAKAVQAGAGHSLAVKSDGTVMAWGDNRNGELGNGTIDSSLLPTPVSISDVKSISSMGWHTLVLKNDGTLWAWGKNGSGRLGDGTETNRSTPVLINLSDVTSIAAGGWHSLALKSDGTVWAWGNNSDGQLGNGNNTNSLVPIQVNGLTGIQSIYCGFRHSMALKNDGTLWAWGYNVDGELGNSTTTSSNVPVQVAGISDIKSITAGWFHTMVVKNDGNLWAWGWNADGQLGDGTTTDRTSPVVITLDNIAGLAAGQNFTLAWKNDGSVWGWGGDEHGQLGDGGHGGYWGNFDSGTDKNAPIEITALSNIKSVSAGNYHTIFIEETPAEDDTLLSCGGNQWGQLGDGTTTDRTTPVQVGMTPELVTFTDSNLEQAVRAKLGLPQGEITPQIMSELTEFDAPSQSIETLNGLQYAVNLERLNLSNNEIADLTPLADLTKLTDLDLSKNQIINLDPMVKLTELQTLSLSFNQIESLTALSGLTKLTTLWLDNNQIAIITPLNSLSLLQVLCLNNNQIGVLPSLNTLSGLQDLELENNQIVEPTSIQDLTTLKTLNLGNNAIVNIGSLSSITGLQSLTLKGNPVSDLTGLGSLTALETLDLSNTEVINLLPLETLGNLKVLLLYNNQLGDLSPLDGLSTLRELYLYNNQLTNISSLAGLSNLEKLSLGNNQIQDISPLGGLTKLNYLTLDSNRIEDIPALVTNVNNGGLSSEDNYLDLSYNYLDLRNDSPDQIAIETLINKGVNVDYQPQNVVIIPVSSVSLNRNTLTLTEGGLPVTLVATVLPADASNIDLIWDSSNPWIASVDNGTVNPVNDGTAVITVTSVDGGFYESCQVTVNARPSAACDLVTQNLIAPSEVMAGAKTNIQVTIANLGTTTSPKSSACFYLVQDSDTILLAEKSLSALKPGKSKSLKAKVIIPVNIPEGQYQFMASVDAAESIIEQDETNNQVMSDVRIVVPDLTIENVSAATLIPGKSANVTVTVANLNNALANKFIVSLYLSSSPDAWDPANCLSSKKILKLAQKSTTVKMKAKLATGFSPDSSVKQYYLVAVVDPDNVISEDNTDGETNNTKSCAVTIGE